MALTMSWHDKMRDSSIHQNHDCIVPSSASDQIVTGEIKRSSTWNMEDDDKRIRWCKRGNWFLDLEITVGNMTPKRKLIMRISYWKMKCFWRETFQEYGSIGKEIKLFKIWWKTLLYREWLQFDCSSINHQAVIFSRSFSYERLMRWFEGVCSAHARRFTALNLHFRAGQPICPLVFHKGNFLTWKSK